MGPVSLAPLAGTILYGLIFLLLGAAFGAVLEMAGFGDSRRLAAQFYLRDMTVLKVMFTGIVVAAILLYLASALQMLDMNRVWVNPTYLVPGIVGGLIMGVGFIVGGFCPGTSLVAAATLKADGIFFVLGGVAGAQLFGETVHHFDAWWHGTSYGRLTIQDWLHLPAGVVILALVAMALGAFVLAERGEERLRPGGGARAGVPGTALSFGQVSLRGRTRWAFAIALLLPAALAAAIGQPTLSDRWRWIEPRAGQQLSGRGVFVHPGEVVDLRKDLTLSFRILEVRSESDYNLFHLSGSERIDPGDARDVARARRMLAAPDNTVFLLAGNGEAAAVSAWKDLKAQGVLNLYILDGGINGWLADFPPHPCVATPSEDSGARPDRDDLAWRFRVAVGDRLPSAHPDLPSDDPAPDCSESPADAGVASAWFDGRTTLRLEYTRKVALQRKVTARGGCG